MRIEDCNIKKQLTFDFKIKKFQHFKCILIFVIILIIVACAFIVAYMRVTWTVHEIGLFKDTLFFV